MDTTSNTADVRATTVAFVNCFDATTFGRTVHMTADEERRLRALLASLRDYGILLRASFEPALPGCGFGDVVDHLRAFVGAHIVKAALAAGGPAVPGLEPEPVAVMPVWAFQPEGGNEDALLSSTRLWNCDVLVEALRVEDDDDPVPARTVRHRFDRWADAAGQGERLKAVRLPGRDGSYVLFAAAAPAGGPAAAEHRRAGASAVRPAATAAIFWSGTRIGAASRGCCERMDPHSRVPQSGGRSNGAKPPVPAVVLNVVGGWPWT
jgi:hypothetical protein